MQYDYLFKDGFFLLPTSFEKKKWFRLEVLVSGLHKIPKYILKPHFTTQIKPLSALMKLSYFPKGVLNQDIWPTGLYSSCWPLLFHIFLDW